MAGLSVRDPAVDRSLRSVFVGNIPYEATEEQLKDIFSEVGPVVSFRLVYDRETGKPKGYGFCEYQDQETALSAMRNLNGREFSGRALRVDNAASEKNKEELKSLGTGAPIIESPYGDPVSPEDAPESISRAVASLPPEQMFELMKQMKLCVQNSPQEARNMLLQNPQLAYALLQAQVVMRIVDPEIALKILHRQTSVPPLIPGSQQAGPGPGPGPNAQLNPQSTPSSQPQPMGGMHVNGAGPLLQPPLQGGVPAPGQMAAPVQGPGPGPMAPGVGRDPRGLEPRGLEPRVLEARALEARGLEARAMEARAMEARALEARGLEPRGPGPNPRGPMPGGIQGPGPLNMGASGPQGPRQVPNMAGAGMQGGGIPGAGVQGAGQPGGFSPGQSQVTPQDHEKAALIMQVLQLTADQIAMLPPEQRQSILILKEQIQKSTGAP
ncbi:cleavage stimulation factor subunit 2 isoform X6 [Colius striatus]|uniref:cleavage stimulation factor subunit 2 isoform X6 n=1 Tax=Colius striatus TaxID=57412 RepID=UPI002B1E7B74|nr:cleavage stimulation factor subunit 2 isoform X6 [Colius striatus]